METPLLDGIRKQAGVPNPLSGMRNTVSVFSKDPRRGTLEGNAVGMGAAGAGLGLLSGLLAGKGTIKNTLMGAGLGGLVGVGMHGLGSALGWRE